MLRKIKADWLIDIGIGCFCTRDNHFKLAFSAENPTGKQEGESKGRDCTKLRPCINIQPGETVTLLDIDGPEIIQNIEGKYPLLNLAKILAALGRGLNSCWKMPFLKHCYITMENRSSEERTL